MVWDDFLDLAELLLVQRGGAVGSPCGAASRRHFITQAALSWPSLLPPAAISSECPGKIRAKACAPSSPTHPPSLHRPIAQGHPGSGVTSVCLIAPGILSLSEFV